MDLDKKGILVSLFQLAERGELDDVEQKDIVNALFSFGFSRISNDFDRNIEEDFKRIRLGSRKILEQTEKCIDTALELVQTQQKLIKKMGSDVLTSEKFAQFGDDENTLTFIKSLDQNYYNFSEAERLVKISRQTLKKHAVKNTHGLKTEIIGKTEYISKESLITYYRNNFNISTYPF